MQILLRFTLSGDVTKQIMDDGIIISISKTGIQKKYIINIVLLLGRFEKPLSTHPYWWPNGHCLLFPALRIKYFRFHAILVSSDVFLLVSATGRGMLRGAGQKGRGSGDENDFKI